MNCPCCGSYKLKKKLGKLGIAVCNQNESVCRFFPVVFGDYSEFTVLSSEPKEVKGENIKLNPVSLHSKLSEVNQHKSWVSEKGCLPYWFCPAFSLLLG